MSASRIVDRGRLLVGFLLVAPLGVLVGMPVLSAGSPDDGPRWLATVDHASAGAGAATAAPSAGEILDRFLSARTAAQGQEAAASAGLVEEGGEGDATSAAATSATGAPPSAELAARLRQAEARFATTQAAPSTDPRARAAALATNPRVVFTRASQITDITSGSIDPRIVDVLTWISTRRQSITITSMRSDHSICVAGSSPCRVSAHVRGRAVDIAAVNGQPCTGVPNSECGRLYEEIVNTLRGTAYQPAQIIHGYDPWPSESWNFEMGNHHDHIHIGY